MKRSEPERSGSTGSFVIAGLAVFLGVFGLIFAASVEHTPSTIPFLHLRPVDARLKLLTLSIGFFGSFFGFASYILNRRSTRPASTIWLFVGVSFLVKLCLQFSGEPSSLSTGLGLMAGFNSVIFVFAMRLTEPPLRRVTRYICRALLVLAPFMGLIGLFKGGLSPAGLLVPNYWIGETLQLEFLTYPFGHAVMVGICFHLFVVMCLVGLAYQSES
ncbi:MAG: hypothetical protein ABJO36_01325 [Litorimonas sp.]